MKNIKELYNFHKSDVDKRVLDFQLSLKNYQDKRGAMIIDVVCSRRRNYEKRVIPMVNKWIEAVKNPSLKTLSIEGAEFAELGLMANENGTLKNVAKGLLRFGEENEIENENEICFKWGKESEKYVFNYFLEPHVGNVKGIGFALFSYLRILCGANTLKIDSRIIDCLKYLGFNTDKKPEELYLTCIEISRELQIDLITLDQFFWGVLSKKVK